MTFQAGKMKFLNFMIFQVFQVKIKALGKLKMAYNAVLLNTG